MTYSKTAGGVTNFNYTPVPDANGYDALVNGEKINPQGIFDGSGANFSLSLTMKIK